jgi:hypothetical protein
MRRYPTALVDLRGPTELDYGARLESKLREVWSRSGRPQFALETPPRFWMNKPRRYRAIVASMV